METVGEILPSKLRSEQNHAIQVKQKERREKQRDGEHETDVV